MAGNNGGPWGGGGNNGGNRGDDDDRRRPPGRPGGGNDGPQIPEIDDLVNKGREQLRVLMGGGKGGGAGAGSEPPFPTKMVVFGGLILLLLFWAWNSFYRVNPEERSVELFFGEFSEVGEPGLNFAPWPVVTYEKVPVTQEQRIDIGTSTTGQDAGLMLTGDENIVDIDFQVVWNIIDPARYRFTLADPERTIRAVSESAMREIIAQSELTPILNTNRGAIAERLQSLIQSTLDEYDSGVNIVRVNFNKAEAPDIQVEVTAMNDSGDMVTMRRSPFDAFREVQNAQQERVRLQNVADAYANRVVAEARGEAAAILEEAEGYRAEVVNNALGEASRFSAVLEQYELAPEVTRKRIYLETMERVLGGVDLILLDETGGEGSQSVVPYLPLNELRRSGGSN
ncbi:protease FtsH subunit HflK [Cognatiyoonia koreensis]|uniref:Protein HflK n=1 Tax=Cognatiyoonia koreensis TaxID=364200 RepID=A0A1I0Q621_9RHOB|nr:FtsH protease activity modulator HflK [Cognatiyoonia koreensis]SEW22225.1 protease FtsH subunit HflK [Cognatiyoonia koreensis]